MISRHSIAAAAVGIAAVLGFTAGVYSAGIAHPRQQTAALEIRARGDAGPPDLLPSHYSNQATEIEELPAQF